MGLSLLNPKVLVVVGGALGMAFLLLFVKDKKRFFFRFLLFAIPIQMGISWVRVAGGGKTLKLIDIPLLALLLIGLAGRKKIFGRVKITSAPFFAGLLLVGWAALSAVFAEDWLTPAVIETINKAEILLISLYVANYIKTTEDLKDTATYLLMGLLFISVIGILQYIFSSTLGLAFMGSYGARQVGGIRRATGTLQLPNIFGAYLALLLPLGISLFVLEKKKVKRMFYSIVSFAGLLALILTFSRGSWLAFALAIFLISLFMVRNRQLRRKVLLIGFAAVVFGVGPIIVYYQKIVDRATSHVRVEDSQWHRKNMVRVAPYVIMANPLLGSGLWNYNIAASRTTGYGGFVHNEYLLTAGELGIPGLIFYLFLMFGFLRRGFKSIKSKDKFISAFGMCLSASYISFFCMVLVNPLSRHFPIQCLVWLLGGMMVAANNIDRRMKKAYRLKKLSVLKGSRSSGRNGKRIRAGVLQS